MYEVTGVYLYNLSQILLSEINFKAFINNKDLLIICAWPLVSGVIRFQILTDDQTKLMFEVKKDDQGKSFLLELNKAIGGRLSS